jgi:hypothetical protein
MSRTAQLVSIALISGLTMLALRAPSGCKSAPCSRRHRFASNPLGVLLVRRHRVGIRLVLALLRGEPALLVSDT